MPHVQEIELLLVEDHLALREMLKESLEEIGFQVFAFESAEEAMTSFDKAAYSIAILDLNLPGEDGLYLAEHLRNSFPKIGVVMLTVRNQLSDKLLGYEAGADIYLPKPIAPEELHAAVHALVRRLPVVDDSKLVLDYRAQKLSCSQENVLLTEADTKLLQVLAQSPKQELEYWALAEKLGLDLDSDKLRVNLEKRVSRLRSKFIELNLPSTTIKSIRNYGYKLAYSIRVL